MGRPRQGVKRGGVQGRLRPRHERVRGDRATRRLVATANQQSCAPVQPGLRNHDAMSTVEIVTERLHVRPFRADDLEEFVSYRSDPEVARHQSWDSPYSMADAESLLSSQR